MKTTVQLFLLTLLSAFAINEVHAQLLQDSSGKRREYIAYISAANPILYGKVGAALSIRTPRMDYFIYNNYRFGPGIIPTKMYHEVFGIPGPNEENASVWGFDIGTQFRYRNPLLSKPYAKYVQNLNNTSSFYGGPAVEVSYARATRSQSDFPNESGQSIIWEPTAGGVFGWTLQQNNLLFDIHLTLKAGGSFIYYEPHPNNMSYVEPGNITNFIIKYELGFSIGYKLVKP